MGKQRVVKYGSDQSQRVQKVDRCWKYVPGPCIHMMTLIYCYHLLGCL